VCGGNRDDRIGDQAEPWEIDSADLHRLVKEAAGPADAHCSRVAPCGLLGLGASAGGQDSGGGIWLVGCADYLSFYARSGPLSTTRRTTQHGEHSGHDDDPGTIPLEGGLVHMDGLGEAAGRPLNGLPVELLVEPFLRVPA